MHEQRASAQDKPRINVSPRNPRAEARRWGLEQSRHLNSVCVCLVFFGGGVWGRVEGEIQYSIKTKQDAQSNSEASERLQFTVALMWLMWLFTRDQRDRGRDLREFAESDKSKGRRKMSGSKGCTAGECLSFCWPHIICILWLISHISSLSGLVLALQHRSPCCKTVVCACLCSEGTARCRPMSCWWNVCEGSLDRTSVCVPSAAGMDGWLLSLQPSVVRTAWPFWEQTFLLPGFQHV